MFILVFRTVISDEILRSVGLLFGWVQLYVFLYDFYQCCFQVVMLEVKDEIEALRCIFEDDLEIDENPVYVSYCCYNGRCRWFLVF